MRCLAWIPCLVALIACSESPALIVDLRTDYEPGVDFGAVRTELVGPRSPVMTAVFASDDFTTGARVAEIEDIEAGTYDLRLTLLDPADASPFAERMQRVDVSGATAVTVEILRGSIIGDGGMPDAPIADADAAFPDADAGGADLERLPPRPSADGDDGTERVFFFVDWVLLPTTTDFGFDQDGRATTDPSSASCTADAVVVDQGRGIDNAYASQLAAQFSAYLMTIGRDVQNELWTLQRQGVTDLLIRLRGWNGMPDDGAVEVDVMHTACGHLATERDCTPGARRAALALDGSDVLYVTRPSVDAFDETSGRFVQSAAYVAGGMLVVPTLDEASLRLPLADGYRSISVRGWNLTAVLPDPSTNVIDEAMITGRWAVDDLTDFTSYLAECPSAADPRAGLIRSAIAGAADIRHEPADDNMGLACNAVSVSLRMTGYRAAYGGPKEPVRLPVACP